jgi:hypothetical protein
MKEVFEKLVKYANVLKKSEIENTLAQSVSFSVKNNPSMVCFTKLGKLNLLLVVRF